MVISLGKVPLLIYFLVLLVFLFNFYQAFSDWLQLIWSPFYFYCTLVFSFIYINHRHKLFWFFQRIKRLLVRFWRLMCIFLCMLSSFLSLPGVGKLYSWQSKFWSADFTMGPLNRHFHISCFKLTWCSTHGSICQSEN